MHLSILTVRNSAPSKRPISLWSDSLLESAPKRTSVSKPTHLPPDSCPTRLLPIDKFPSKFHTQLPQHQRTTPSTASLFSLLSLFRYQYSSSSFSHVRDRPHRTFWPPCGPSPTYAITKLSRSLFQGSLIRPFLWLIFWLAVIRVCTLPLASSKHPAHE